jgi:hypothetical protein
MCDQCRLIDTINDAMHEATKAASAREDSSTPVERYWMFRTACASYLFEALKLLGMRVVGVPDYDQPRSRGR